MYQYYGQAAAPGEDPSNPNRQQYMSPYHPPSYPPGSIPPQPTYGSPAPNQWPSSAYGSPAPQPQQQQQYAFPQQPTSIAPTSQFA